MTPTRFEERLRADLPRLADLLTAGATAIPAVPEVTEVTEATERAPRRRRRSTVAAIAVAAVAAIGLVTATAVVPRGDQRGAPGSGREAVTTEPGWRTLPPSPLGARAGVSLAWTGSEVLVWGGYRTGGVTLALGDGAAYDPTTGRWRALGDDGFTHPGSSSAWTGTELVMLAKNGGSAYDPIGDRWRRLPLVFGHPGTFVAAAWTGETVLGLLYDASEPEVAVARLDDAAATWTAGAAQAIDTRDDGTTVSVAWTGDELVVWTDATRGWSYAPETDTWRDLPALPFDAAATQGAVVAVDGTVAVAYARGSGGDRLVGVTMPTEGGWRVVAEVPAPGFATPAPVVTDGGVVVLDGTGGGTPVRIEPATGSGERLAGFPLAGAPGTAGVWTGDGLFVWGGFPEGTPATFDNPTVGRPDAAWLGAGAAGAAPGAGQEGGAGIR